MIELRWVVRHEPYWGAPHDDGLMRAVKVLQYRTRKVSVSEFGNIEAWSDWQDVPTAKEPT